MPGAKPLKRLQKVVGEGDRAVGGRLRVGVLARFGKKNHRTLLPKTGRVPKIEAGSVNKTEHMQYIRGEVQEENGLESVRAIDSVFPGVILNPLLFHCPLKGFQLLQPLSLGRGRQALFDH